MRNESTRLAARAAAAIVIFTGADAAAQAAPTAGFDPVPAAADPAPEPAPAPSPEAAAPEPSAPAAPVYPYPPPSPYAYPYPPYSPYPYPPPGWGHAPPAAAPLPAREKKPAAPPVKPHTAVRSSPFLSLLIGGLLINRRFSSAFNPGVEGGLFIADRVRLALRLMAPIEEPNDDYGFDDEPLAGQDFQPIDSEPPSLIGGGSLGFVAVDLPGFTISPSVYVLRSDVGDYGTIVGIGLPFEWITQSGLRVGFDFALVRAMGGEVRGQCGQVGTGSCDPGEIRVFDREAGNGFMSSFIIGWALGRPAGE